MSSPDLPFGRLLTAMVTPFTADGDLDLSAAAELAAYLSKKAYSPDYGARELRRLIEVEIELPLARWLKESRADKSIVYHLDSGAICITDDPAG